MEQNEKRIPYLKYLYALSDTERAEKFVDFCETLANAGQLKETKQGDIVEDVEIKLTGGMTW